MRNEEIKAELAALRAEVVALSAAREQTAEPEPPPEASALATKEDAGSQGEHEGSSWLWATYAKRVAVTCFAQTHATHHRFEIDAGRLKLHLPESTPLLTHEGET